MTNTDMKTRRKAAELRQAEADATKAEEDATKSRLDREMAELELDSERLSREFVFTMPEHTGKFSLDGTVTDHSVGILRNKLLSFSQRKPGAPVEVTITSPGGSVFDGLNLWSTLRYLSAEGHFVTTIVSGWAASMGGILAQAGDHRVMGAESVLMLHEVATGVIGKAAEIQDRAELAKRLTRQAADIFARRSTMTSDEIYERIERRDWWLWPDDALAVGFVDEVRSA